MTTDTRYNGWTNYETWAVKLWIDNEESSCDYWRDRTREIFLSSVPAYDFLSQQDTARTDLADELKREHEENAPETIGVFADLLNAALGSVDWREIADAMLSDMAEQATHDQDEEILEAWNTPAKRA